MALLIHLEQWWPTFLLGAPFLVRFNSNAPKKHFLQNLLMILLKCIFYKVNILLESKTFDPSSNLLLNGIHSNAFLLKKMVNIPKYSAMDID